MYPTPYPTGMTLGEPLHYVDPDTHTEHPATLIGPADAKGHLHLNVHYPGKLEARRAPLSKQLTGGTCHPQTYSHPPITPKAPSFIKQVQKFMKEQS